MRLNSKAIERHRWSQGLTIRALAIEAGLSESYLSELLSGAHAGTAPTAKRLADALGVEVLDIVTEDNGPRKAVAS